MKEIVFPEPDEVFSEKPSLYKYFRYLLFFGPGAVVASLTIGQGQLILGPQIGAWAGFSLLWLITLNIGSYIIAYISCRFTMISGIGVTDLFAIKTKKGWLNWLFIVIMIIFIPVFTATIITSLGQALQWIFGIGHYLIWGVSFCVIAGIIVLVGKFKLFEITHAFFIAILAIGAVIAVISLKPDILNVIPNFFAIGQNVPGNYPEWVIENYPSVTQTSIPLYMLAYLGTLTITLVTLISYLGWIKVKKWGIFKDKKDPDKFSQICFNDFRDRGEIVYLPKKSGEIKKACTLLKPIKIDLTLAFIVVSIVSAAYMIAGGILLKQNKILPSDVQLVQNQLIIFTYLADWLKPLFQIGVVFALFGTVYAGFEAVTRMLYETSKNIIRKIKVLEYKQFMFIIFLYILVTSIPLAILMYIDPNFSVLFLLSITLLFIGVVGVIIYGIGVISLSQTVLPKEYRLGIIGLFLSFLAVILITIPFVFLFI